MSQNQNGISSHFSSQNSSQIISIELPPSLLNNLIGQNGLLNGLTGNAAGAFCIVGLQCASGACTNSACT